MPRWLTWVLCIGGGIVAGAAVAPCLLGAIGDLMGPDAQGPGFLGYLIGLVVGPVIGGVFGAALAWNATRPDDEESATDASTTGTDDHAGAHN